MIPVVKRHTFNVHSVYTNKHFKLIKASIEFKLPNHMVFFEPALMTIDNYLLHYRGLRIKSDI